MNDYDQKDMEEVLDEAKDASIDHSGEFEGELFLSTDGKNTVHVKATTSAGRASALKWAKAVYDAMKERYGTKQDLNKQTYDPKEDLGVCAKCGAPNLRSMKGKIYCSAKCWLKE